MTWTERAACRGHETDLWFSGDRPGKNGLTPRASERARAQEICGSCPVREECLADAVARGERFGVWGGLTPRQRERHAQELRQAGVAVPSSRAGQPGPDPLAELMLAPCGTESAIRRHARRDEPLCDACRSTLNEINRDRYRRRMAAREETR